MALFGILNLYRFCKERAVCRSPTVAYTNHMYEFVSTVIILDKEPVQSLSSFCIGVLLYVHCCNKVLDILWRKCLIQFLKLGTDNIGCNWLQRLTKLHIK